MFPLGARAARRMLLSPCDCEASLALTIPRYDDAVALLHSLSGAWGIRASASDHANYGAVFARDAVMAGIAGLLTGDAAVINGLAHTLGHLRDLQGSEGQIASNYMLARHSPPRVSFGTLVPRLDSPLWYLIGIGLSARAGALDPAPYRHSVRRVVHLLDALEYNGRHLLYVPVGGNWADEYIYDGYVLHDQVLRTWGLRLMADTFDEPLWRTKSARIEATIVDTFAASSPARPYPVAALSPIRTHDMFDLATCALLGASGIAPALAEPALEWIDTEFLARGALPPAFHPVIDEAHADWPALVRYQLHGFRNRPHEYHNGGIWTIWLGWLALALARTGRLDSLARLSQAMATRLSASGGFAFEEFFHGHTGRPGGTTHMAYSATGIIFLRTATEPAVGALLAP